MLLAYLAALGCAVCYGLGSVLQGIGARRVEAGDRLQPRLLVRVATQAPYMAGLGLDAVGWLLSLLALIRLPLFAVQAVVAAAIVFVVLFSALVDHVPINRQQLLFVAALSLGLAGLGLSAAPDAARSVSAGFTWTMWISIVVIAALGTLAPRWLSAAAASSLLGALAGLAFGGTALCARSLGADRLWVGVLRDPLAWALLAFGALGLSFYAAALQRGNVTVATAWQTTTSTIAPAVIGLWVLGDHARSGWAGVALVAFVVTIGATIGLTFATPPGVVASSPELRRADDATRQPRPRT
jgi:drug/metabolite transporter (DMT)-like permease